MNRSAEFQANRRELLKRYKGCEFCGDDRGLEVHHSIPLSVGGTDDKDNLIVCCSKCHAILHRGNRSILTKLGLSRLQERHLAINFYKHFEALKGDFDVYEVFDYLDKYVFRDA